MNDREWFWWNVRWGIQMFLLTMVLCLEAYVIYRMIIQ